MEEKKYVVARYWDDHHVETVAKNLTKEEAKKLAEELNEKVKGRPLTEYLIR